MRYENHSLLSGFLFAIFDKKVMPLTIMRKYGVIIVMCDKNIKFAHNPFQIGVCVV